MGNLKIAFCDMCKEVKEKENLVYSIRAWEKKKNKDKISKTTKGDICKNCFVTIFDKINENPEFSTMSKLTTKDDVSIMPSKNVTKIHSPGKEVKEKKCSHERNHFDPEKNILTCRDCGKNVSA